MLAVIGETVVIENCQKGGWGCTLEETVKKGGGDVPLLKPTQKLS